mgnify:FL=1
MSMPLILVDDDPHYVRRFAEWTRLHPETGFRLASSEGTDPDDPIRDRGNPHAPLLLIAGTCWSRMQDRRHMRRILLEDGTAMDREVPFRIAKFQPVPDLLRAVRAGAEKRGWMAPPSVPPVAVRLHVVIHLAGSAHRQPVAPVLAAWCAKERDTLLLDLDPMQATRPWFAAHDGEGMSRLAYEAGGGKGLDRAALERCLSRDSVTGVRCLRPPTMPEDAAGFDAEAVRQVIAAASATGRLYLAATADPYGMCLFEEADTLLRRLGTMGAIPGCTQDESLCRLAIACGAPCDGWRGKMAGTLGACEAPVPVSVVGLPDPFPQGWPDDPWALGPDFVAALAKAAHCDDERWSGVGA